MVTGMTAVTDLAARDRAVGVLCDPSLSHVVDLVAFPDRDGAVVVANADGAVRLTAGRHELMPGAAPGPDEDPLAFPPLPAGLAARSPANADNAYPGAYERLASLFAAQAAP